MSDPAMLVDRCNRRELRIVAASLAASLGIHAVAFGLVPQAATGVDDPLPPINVTLRAAARTRADVPEESALRATRDAPVAAAPVVKRAAPHEPSSESTKLKQEQEAVPAKRPLARRPATAAAKPSPEPPPLARSRHASASNASALMAVAREPVRKTGIATTLAATTPRPTTSGSTTSPPTAPSPATPPQFRADYLNNPPPAYPRQARRDGIEGIVTIKVLVTAAGTPGMVALHASSGSDALDRAALNAIKAWRFVPARRGDEAVDAWVLVPVAFRLESG